MTETIEKKPKLRKSRAPAEFRPGWWGDLDSVAEKLLSRRGVTLYESHKAWIWGPIEKPRRFEKPEAMGMLNLFIVERFLVEIDERAAEINKLARDTLTPEGLDQFAAYKVGLSFGNTRLTDSLDLMDSFVKRLAAIQATDDMTGLERIERCKLKFNNVCNFAGAPALPADFEPGALS